MGHLVETAAVDAVAAVVLVVARLAAENAGFVDADGADDAVVADVGVVRLVDEVVGFAVAGAGAVAADVDAVVLVVVVVIVVVKGPAAVAVGAVAAPDSAGSVAAAAGGAAVAVGAVVADSAGSVPAGAAVGGSRCSLSSVEHRHYALFQIPPP